MSLVIEALRRVEKTDSRTGSIGAAVSSYRPTPKPRGSTVPLLLGLLTGGALVFLFTSPSRIVTNPSSPTGDPESLSVARAHLRKGAAGLPPPLIIDPARTAAAPTSAGPRPGPEGAAGERRIEPARAEARPLVLQAISERDSRPIAIINDQLVKEGDKVGLARVLRIGSDSVEVSLENGTKDTIRFAPPPPPEPSPSPSPSPEFR